LHFVSFSETVVSQQLLIRPEVDFQRLAKSIIFRKSFFKVCNGQQLQIAAFGFAEKICVFFYQAFALYIFFRPILIIDIKACCVDQQICFAAIKAVVFVFAVPVAIDFFLAELMLFSF
jgi:hypothetical protein